MPLCSLVPPQSFSSGVRVFMATRDPISCFLSSHAASHSCLCQLTSPHSTWLAASHRNMTQLAPVQNGSLWPPRKHHTFCLTSHFLCHLSANACHIPGAIGTQGPGQHRPLRSSVEQREEEIVIANEAITCLRCWLYTCADLSSTLSASSWLQGLPSTKVTAYPPTTFAGTLIKMSWYSLQAVDEQGKS